MRGKHISDPTARTNHQIAARLDPALWYQIETWALQTGISRSDIVCAALTEYFSGVLAKRRASDAAWNKRRIEHEQGIARTLSRRQHEVRMRRSR